MKAWLMALALGRRRQLVTKTFTANSTVPIPQGVSRLESIIGKGASGDPGTPGTPGQNGYRQTTETTLYRRDGGEPDVVRSSGLIPGSPVPENYCTERSVGIGESVVYNFRRDCYSYEYAFIPGTETSPTTGASATGFGQTFVGGYGGAATPREVKNVAVTPGGSYQVVVPAGGSITISYYL